MESLRSYSIRWTLFSLLIFDWFWIDCCIELFERVNNFFILYQNFESWIDKSVYMVSVPFQHWKKNWKYSWIEGLVVKTIRNDFEIFSHEWEKFLTTFLRHQFLLKKFFYFWWLFLFCLVFSNFSALQHVKYLRQWLKKKVNFKPTVF